MNKKIFRKWNEKTKMWTARERLMEASATGAKALVTACSWCERNFLDAQTGSGREMEIYDIVELVQKAL
jgi:Fe-S oxidoreductase